MKKNIGGTEWNAEKRMNESLQNQLLKTKYKEYTQLKENTWCMDQ